MYNIFFLNWEELLIGLDACYSLNGFALMKYSHSTGSSSPARPSTPLATSSSPPPPPPPRPPSRPKLPPGKPSVGDVVRDNIIHLQCFQIVTITLPVSSQQILNVSDLSMAYVFFFTFKRCQNSPLKIPDQA